MELIEVKADKHKYTKQQIKKVMELLDKQIPISEIAEQVGFSNRRTKKIRYLHNKANQDELDLLFQCKYLISSIEKSVKKRISNNKKPHKRS